MESEKVRLSIVSDGGRGFEDYTLLFFDGENQIARANWSKGNSHSKGHFTVSLFGGFYINTMPPIFGRQFVNTINRIFELKGLYIEYDDYLKAIASRVAHNLDKQKLHEDKVIKEQEVKIRKIEAQLRAAQKELKQTKRNFKRQ